MAETLADQGVGGVDGARPPRADQADVGRLDGAVHLRHEGVGAADGRAGRADDRLDACEHPLGAADGGVHALQQPGDVDEQLVGGRTGPLGVLDEQLELADSPRRGRDQGRRGAGRQHEVVDEAVVDLRRDAPDGWLEHRQQPLRPFEQVEGAAQLLRAAHRHAHQPAGERPGGRGGGDGHRDRPQRQVEDHASEHAPPPTHWVAGPPARAPGPPGGCLPPRRG